MLSTPKLSLLSLFFPAAGAWDENGVFHVEHSVEMLVENLAN
jgi:hypothetical protein